MLVIIWHLLSDPDLEYVDLAADYYELPVRPASDRQVGGYVGSGG